MALSVEQLQQIVGLGVPFNHLLGIQVTRVEAEEVELTLSQKPDYLNHVGTFHAAAQFALGEATSGTMLIASFAHVIQGEYVPLPAGASIKYRRPASGDLRGVAILTKGEQDRIWQEVRSNGKARFPIHVQLFSADNNVTTEMSVDWVIMKRK